MLLAVLVVVPNMRDLGPINPGPYSVYHHTGEWLARNAPGNERVLDMTDWSLYFSGRTGYNFADVYEAPADPHTRWIVVRDGQIDGPSAVLPGHPRLDRRSSTGRTVTAGRGPESDEDRNLRPPA